MTSTPTIEDASSDPQRSTSDDASATPTATNNPTTSPTGGGSGLHTAARLIGATALVGAAIIHFAYAPGHLDEEFSHGAFFLVTGWLGLALATGLVLRARPERVWLAATALVNLGIVAVWLVSRTVGVPGSEAEGVGFPDVTATVLELIAVVAALALLTGVLADRPLGRDRTPIFGLAGVGALATVTLVSMAVSPSFAGEHGAGGHGHDGGAGEEAAGHGHDGAASMASGSGSASAEEWADQRFSALAGYSSDEQVDKFKQLEADYLSEQILSRSDVLRELPPAEAEERLTTYVDWAVENTIALLDGAQTNGEGMHSHGATAWQPITDPADQLELQAQLDAASKVIDQFPTVAAAEAAGYRQIAPYVPGIAAHWINGDFDGEFDPGKPEMLLFNGTEQTSRLVGLSYATIGDEPPEGFVGPNDTWHAHPGLCMLEGFVVGIDGTPEDLCTSIGGDIATNLRNLQMAHLWQVPGWESPWGLFSAENPNVNVATSDLMRTLEP